MNALLQLDQLPDLDDYTDDVRALEERTVGVVSQLLANALYVRLKQYCSQQRPDLVPILEVTIRLAKKTPALKPDVAVIPLSRWPFEDVPQGDPATMVVVPALAVEVVSPTDRAVEVEDKMHKYFERGVESVWLIYPDARRLYAAAANTLRVFHAGDKIDGAPVLPGLQLSLTELFAALPRRPQPVSEAADGVD